MGFLKKVIKVVAVVAAVALAIPTGGGSLLAVGAAGIGVSLSALGATALVAGLTVASALLNKPKVPPVSPASTARLNASIDPRTPRKMVFGTTAMAADIRDMEYTGEDDEYLHYFIVNAAHAINRHTAIYFDDKLAWTASGGVQGEYVGYLTVTPRVEGTAANAINIGPRMGSTRRYTGLAYVHLRFKRTGNSKKAESPFSSAIPQRMTFEGEALKLYDPRQDSTVPGGSGSHRIDNQATWTWGGHCRNPAIQLLAYLTGYRINGRLSVGKGIPVSRLHLGSFMTAANACDEPITLAAGGTQPRYRSDGIFSEADDMGAVIDSFKAVMAAEIDDSDGRFAVRLLVNDLDDPIAAFGPDDFLDGLTWRPIADISSRFNVIRGQYVDPREQSLYQMVDYPEVLLPSVDGIERAHSFPLALVQDPAQAQRTAKQLLQRQQYSGTLEVQTGHTGWLVQKYDIVTITHPPLGFYDKLFRVAAMTVGTHGQVQFTLREENVAIYAWEHEEKPPVQPAGVTTYEPSNNPIIQGIEDSAFLITPSVPAVALPAINGVIKGGLPTDVVFTARAGEEDVTALTTWSNPVMVGATVTHVGNVYTITAVSSDTASLEVTGTYGGVSQTMKIPITYLNDGDAAQFVEDTSVSNTTSGVFTPVSDTLTLNATTGVNIQFTYSEGYIPEAGSPEGGIASKDMRFMYRNVTDAGAWTQAGPDFIGSNAVANYIVFPSEPDYTPGSVSGLQDLTGPGSTKIYEFRLEMRYSGGITLVASSGTFRVALS